MLITTICRVPVVRVTLTKPYLIRGQIFRTLADDSRESIGRTVRRTTLKEKAMAPPGPNAFSVGKGALAGVGVIGLGALCYYGLGLSNESGIIDKTVLWPPVVKERIRTTYLYFGSSIAVSAASAVAVFRNPTLLRLVTRNGWLSLIGVFAAMIGTGMLAQGIEYQPGFGVKQLAWLLHASVMGGVLAPMCFLGGPILMRACWYTAGVVGGLSAISVCAPGEKFLSLGAPLGMGLGAVVAASFANMWLPPTTALGAGIYSFSLYGGLIIFGGFLLYDTQRIIKIAENHPEGYGYRPFDPINAALSIYMDTLNIFIRIAMIMAGGGQRRK